MIKLTDFGHTGLVGLQHKGLIRHDDKDLYVKLDRLNPSISGEWENRFDYLYSSVSESIASCIVNNLTTEHRHASYTFTVFEENGELLTGTTSEVFLKENEIEQLLSVSNNAKAEATCSIPLSMYIDKVVDVDPKSRLDNLVTLFVDNHVDPNKARSFLLEQATFDVLTGNHDRLGNPSNFSFAYNNVTKTTEPVNLDYGRTFQNTMWFQKMEDVFSFTSDYYQEDLSDFSKSSLATSDGILSAHNLKASIERLHQFGAEPLKLDITKTLSDLEDLREQFTGLPFEKFAKMKCDVVSHMLTSDLVSELVQDTPLMPKQATTLKNDKEENHMTITLDGQDMVFLLSGQPVLRLTVDTDAKKVSRLISYDDFASDIILPKTKRYYNGLESQLQHYIGNKLPLPDIIENIKNNGFDTPIHYNLDIEISDKGLSM